jgi:hypothetical protein
MVIGSVKTFPAFFRLETETLLFRDHKQFLADH